jgi:hypothetical protein
MSFGWTARYASILLLLCVVSVPATANEAAKPVGQVDWDALLQRAIPPRPPQVSYDPSLAQTPECLWRHLDMDKRNNLLARAEYIPPFPLVIFAKQGRLKGMGPSGFIVSVDVVKQCDPNFMTHTDASYVAAVVGLTEGLSLTRLENLGVSQAKLDAVWRDDPDLRNVFTRAFTTLAAAKSLAGAPNEVWPVIRKGWSELGQRPSGPVVGGMPELAASSYWMARGWEAVVIDPMTVQPNQSRLAGVPDR